MSSNGVEKPVRVLIVENNEAMRNALWAVVAATPGFRFAGTATSGQDIDLTVSIACPDLVLLDVRIPGASGYELARHLRSEYPDLVVALLSASSFGPEDDPTFEVVDKLSVSPRWLTEYWLGHRRPNSGWGAPPVA